MPRKKKIHPKVKSKLHPRSRHRDRYDFEALVKSSPALSAYVRVNDYGDTSVDFFDPNAVMALNTALLFHYYGITRWQLPKGYLCPGIPGRADYLHHIADLLADTFHGNIPTGPQVRCFDVGIGASCVYPIIGVHEYGWSFIGTDIDHTALESCGKIVVENAVLEHRVELRLQQNAQDILNGVLLHDEYIDVVICNPPFHASQADADSAALRKLSNLKRKKTTTPIANFQGRNSELWYQGGERRFLELMILQSSDFQTTCCWYSSLVSKHSNLERMYATLDQVGAVDVKTIPTGQGNKVSRIVAWTFLSAKQREAWAQGRWS